MLIIISGPIASGKSTVARSLARLLEERHTSAAVIDLDLVYEMLDHASGRPKDDDAIWRLARRSAATLATTMLEDGVDDVIIEGTFLEPGERAELIERLPPVVRPLYVTLQVSFETALHRAQADPTRGVSRDPVFLGRHFADVADAVARPPGGDLVIDTETVSTEEAAARIAEATTRRRAGVG